MTGNPTQCTLVVDAAKKVECACGGGAAGLGRWGPAAASPSPSTNSTANSTAGLGVVADVCASGHRTRPGGSSEQRCLARAGCSFDAVADTCAATAAACVLPAPSTTPPPTAGMGAPATTTAAATTTAPLSKNGWTLITTNQKGCCKSVAGFEYDSYDYNLLTLAQCRGYCEAEAQCRGIEFPWLLPAGAPFSACARAVRLGFHCIAR